MSGVGEVVMSVVNKNKKRTRIETLINDPHATLNQFSTR